jgi:hypothetical protein
VLSGGLARIRRTCGAADLPVHPEGGSIDGEEMYRSIALGIGMAIIVRPTG